MFRQAIFVLFFSLCVSEVCALPIAYGQSSATQEREILGNVQDANDMAQPFQDNDKPSDILTIELIIRHDPDLKDSSNQENVVQDQYQYNVNTDMEDSLMQRNGDENYHQDYQYLSTIDDDQHMGDDHEEIIPADNTKDYNTEKTSAESIDQESSDIKEGTQQVNIHDDTDMEDSIVHTTVDEKDYQDYQYLFSNDVIKQMDDNDEDIVPEDYTMDTENNQQKNRAKSIPRKNVNQNAYQYTYTNYEEGHSGGWIQKVIQFLLTWLWIGGVILLVVSCVGICCVYKFINRYGDNIPVKSLLQQQGFDV